MAPLSLTGLRVLLTRPEGEGADDWAAAFARAGALAVSYPTVAVVEPERWGEVDGALAKVDAYDWLVLTSQTTVRFLLARLPAGRFPDRLAPRIATVGRHTAAAVEAAGGRVALVPDDERQEGLARALAAVASAARVLLPTAAGARPLLAQSLRDAGATVDVVVVYRTRRRRDLPPVPPFDVATFASPSALQAFLDGPGKDALANKGIAVIGPTTAEAAVAHGLWPWVAKSPGVEGLIRAIAESRPAKGDR